MEIVSSSGWEIFRCRNVLYRGQIYIAGSGRLRQTLQKQWTVSIDPSSLNHWVQSHSALSPIALGDWSLVGFGFITPFFCQGTFVFDFCLSLALLVPT